MARKIKIRAREKGGTTTVKFLLKHPMGDRTAQGQEDRQEDPGTLHQ